MRGSRPGLRGFYITVTNNASGIVPDVVSETEATASEKITAAGFVPKFNFRQERAADPVKKYLGEKSKPGRRPHGASRNRRDSDDGGDNRQVSGVATVITTALAWIGGERLSGSRNNVAPPAVGPVAGHKLDRVACPFLRVVNVRRHRLEEGYAATLTW